MAILNRFLHLLKFLEDLADFCQFLNTSVGATFVFCLISYQSLILINCDAPSSAILAGAAALTFHCSVNRPSF